MIAGLILTGQVELSRRAGANDPKDPFKALFSTSILCV